MNDPISRWSPKRTPARECLGEGDLAYATATVKISYLKALNIRTQGGGTDIYNYSYFGRPFWMTHILISLHINHLLPQYIHFT